MKCSKGINLECREHQNCNVKIIMSQFLTSALKCFVNSIEYFTEITHL